jgi:hypothetical protein
MRRFDGMLATVAVAAGALGLAGSTAGAPALATDAEQHGPVRG